MLQKRGFPRWSDKQGMNYNYHTHTHWCDHASGTPEEYIENAIQGGIQYMGFSDHSPWIFPDGYESHYRVPMAKAEGYMEELNGLRDIYRDRIQLSIGFEMEFYPLYFDKMLDNIRRFGGEYLILGQHFLGNEHPDGHSAQRNVGDDNQLKEYVETVVQAMKTGVFTYVAHPDIFKYGGEDGFYLRQMEKICAASCDGNVPLEINFLGIRRNRNYPDQRFWELVGKFGCPVTFGCDAHQAFCACDGASVEKAEALVKQYHLNYIGKPELVRP
jgi:histidinol-phosphatase (PHP family)